jgi:hypothetical protein
VAVDRIDDERRPQVDRYRRLAPVQAELREVVVDVRDRAGRRLFGLFGGRTFHLFDDFFFREELAVDPLGPLERRVRGVVPEALEVRMAVGQSRHLVVGLCGQCRDEEQRDRRSEGRCRNKSTQHVQSPVPA